MESNFVESLRDASYEMRVSKVSTFKFATLKVK